MACAALLWSTTSIASKTLYETGALQPLAFAFFRLLVASPFFLILSRRRAEQRRRRPQRRAWWWLIGLGLAQAVYQMSYQGAVQLAGAGVSTLIALCLAPIFVAVLAVPLLQENLARGTLLALSAAILGTICLTLEHGLAFGGAWLYGVGGAVVAAIAYGAFTLVSRFSSSVFAPFETAFVCFFAGALIVLPFALAAGNLGGLFSLSPWHVLLLLYVSLVPTCVGYMCFFQGMRSTSAILSSIIVMLEPLFAAFLAWLLLGEAMTFLGLLGSAVLVAAVVGAALSRRPRRAGSQ